MPTSPRMVLDDLVSSLMEEIESPALKVFESLLAEELESVKGIDDYYVISEADGPYLNLSVTVDFKALSTETQDRIKKATASTDKLDQQDIEGRSEAKMFVRKWSRRPDGRFFRIQGQFDARKPALSRRRRQSDMRKGSFERMRKPTAKTSGNRYYDHEYEAVNPRGISAENKALAVEIGRSVRVLKSTNVYPQAGYVGMMRELDKKISEIILEKVIPRLNGMIN